MVKFIELEHLCRGKATLNTLRAVLQNACNKKAVVQKDDESVVKIWRTYKDMKNKLKYCFKTNVKFIILYGIKKYVMFFLLKIRSLLIRDSMLFTQEDVLYVVKTMSEKLIDV